ncbi:CopD family protein [Streptosporangiaceae bacterium NEAU-GS5]|nr:CopD family protein [Streptosporangiaceae bacterium NEAU-GS5]
MALRDIPASPRRWAVGVLLAGLIALLAAYWMGGDRGVAQAMGLPSPGLVTTWGLPVVRLLHDMCAIGTTGTLLAGLLLDRPVGRAAQRWALGWAATAAVTVLLTLSDFLGEPVPDALRSGALPTFLLHIPQGQAFLAVYGLALAIVLGTFIPAVAVRQGLLLALAIAATLPPAYAGHSASAADHQLAIASLMVHVAGVTLWVGGVFGLLVFVRAAGEPERAVRRFSTLALCCYAAVGLSGALNAWIRLGAPDQLWRSTYGLLVLAKVAALVALAWFGNRHRRSTIAALGRTRAPFLRLAAAELAVMAAALGLAVALSRTPPPSGAHAAGQVCAPVFSCTKWRAEPAAETI